MGKSAYLVCGCDKQKPAWTYATNVQKAISTNQDFACQKCGKPWQHICTDQGITRAALGLLCTGNGKGNGGKAKAAGKGKGTNKNAQPGRIANRWQRTQWKNKWNSWSVQQFAEDTEDIPMEQLFEFAKLHAITDTKEAVEKFKEQQRSNDSKFKWLTTTGALKDDELLEAHRRKKHLRDVATQQ